MKLFLLQVGIGSAGILLLLLPCMLPFAASSGKSKITVSDSSVLQQYLCGTNDQQVPNNTVLELTSPSYVLNASGLCLVSDRHNIGIVSNMEEPSVISCTTKSGLGFVNVNVLNITNVNLQSCGAAILPLTNRLGATTGPYLPNTSHASLAIVDSSAVSLSTVVITSYYGYAILAVNVYGVSVLSGLGINRNNNTSPFVGSGVMVYYHNSSNPASLSISNSFLMYNKHSSSACLPELLAPLSHSTPIPTPYASALSVVYNQVSQNVSVTIASSMISENIGSPQVLILYFDSLPNVTTMICNITQMIYTQFSANEDAQYKCRGTSLAMVTYFSTYFAMKYNMSDNWTALSVSQTTIGPFDSGTQSKNVVYLSTSQINGLLVHVVFQNVKILRNNAAELLYAKTMSSSDNNIKSLVVHFIDVLVDGNIHYQVTKNYLYMPGAIMIFVDVAAVYLSDTNFTHNVGSVIEAYNTDVYMSGNIWFNYNCGSNGATLLLLGQSHLFLYLNLSAHFVHNTYKYGGAIYGFNDRVSDNNCTFQVLSSSFNEISDHGPLIFFQGNIASIGHTSVSAISMNKCQQMQFVIMPSEIYNTIFKFSDDYMSNAYSSNPARIVPCVKGEPQYNYSNLSHTYTVRPGENFTISLAAFDAIGKSIETLVQVRFYHGQNHHSLQPSSWWLSDCENEQMLDGSAMCTNITLTIHTKQLEDSYSISTAFFSFPNDVSTFQAEIVLKQCPPGFELNNVTGVCECSSLIKTMNRDFRLDFTCDIQNSVVNVPKLEPWIGCNNMKGNTVNIC